VVNDTVFTHDLALESGYASPLPLPPRNQLFHARHLCVPGQSEKESRGDREFVLNAVKPAFRLQSVAAPAMIVSRRKLTLAAVAAGLKTRRSSRASPRTACGRLLRLHRDHQALVGFAGVHDEGLRRVFDIRIARIGTEHLACCAANDHHVRPGLDPMLVRVAFSEIMIARASVTG
jgi:hypothetical protein